MTRARPNFNTKKKDNKVSKFITNVSHFRKTIQRNEDFFNYIISEECHITKLITYLDSMSIKEFTITLSIYGMSGDTHSYDFIIKNVGTLKQPISPIALLEGDRLRFDIKEIDSVYENIADFGIGFTLDFGK